MKESYNTLAAALLQCTDDMRKAAQEAAFPLYMQLRAYDMLDRLLAIGKDGLVMEGDHVIEISRNFCLAYETIHDELSVVYDEQELLKEADDLLNPLREELNNLRFEAASAASLHEFAKEVFDIWQTSGIFARRRALRELRERAGFRLESHRIGNYVAKTFDLMNEAQARFARAQQTLFAADVKYKIKPGIYKEIYNLLSSQKL